MGCFRIHAPEQRKMPYDIKKERKYYKGGLLIMAKTQKITGLSLTVQLCGTECAVIRGMKTAGYALSSAVHSGKLLHSG